MISLSNKAALVFGGQGSQFTGMGKRIYDNVSEARLIFDLASETVGYDVAKMCFEASQEELNKTIYCQVCTLTVELAIYEVFKKMNIRLNAVAGYSLGEYAALVVAGVIDIKTAFELVNARAKAMQNEVDDNAGKMVAIVNLNIEILKAICQEFGYDNAAIANYNSFNQIVVSTTADVFQEFLSRVNSEGGRAIPLKVNRPFHHSMMLPAADKYRDDLNTAVFKKSILPVYLNISGTLLHDNDCLPQKLCEQIFKPVQWIKTMQSMLATGINVFYEISPKSTLATFIKNIAGINVKIVDVQATLTNFKNV